MPCKTAKTSTGPSCATPKPVCRGPCGQPSARMPPTLSQAAIQSVWGPTMGSPGHPGSGKIEKTTNFTHSGVPDKNTCQKPEKSGPRTSIGVPLSQSPGNQIGAPALFATCSTALTSFAPPLVPAYCPGTSTAGHPPITAWNLSRYCHCQ